MSRSVSYKDAGVNIDEAHRAVSDIRRMARATFTKGVLTDIGSFGGCFALPKMKQPVLVSSVDGVGTKLKIAFATGRHDTIGEDLVNHCVNDIAVQGAAPLFFLDYLAVGKLDARVAAQVISGIARGCRNNGCALIGGETAEMPGIYHDGEYDLAGAIVGIVEKSRMLTGAKVRTGDILVGLPSTGLHTNGYSLARRIVAERMQLGVGDPFPGEEATVGDTLLRIHRSYLPMLRPILGKIHGMAHITGGGLPGNVNRVLPDTLDATIDGSSWPVPNLFLQLERAGQVSRAEMYRTFNMGVGMVVITDEAGAAAVQASARSANVDAWRLGRTVRGTGQVRIS
jgi:phosphoribosylformylglycinamidine cyclo-ligase